MAKNDKKKNKNHKKQDKLKNLKNQYNHPVVVSAAADNRNNDELFGDFDPFSTYGNSRYFAPPGIGITQNAWAFDEEDNRQMGNTSKNGAEEQKDENRREDQKQKEEMIRESGQVILKNKGREYCIHLITIIGEIEGHECLGSNSKTTKYEHILPQLAAIEDSMEVDGLLILLNTMGGDVEAGLAIAEMIASIGKPTVSLVLGGSHSIGIPIAVSTDYSFIVPSATMVIHPVRLNGMVIGVQQTFDYFRKIQNRILDFITHHCRAGKKRLEELMMETEILTKDVGTILVGKEAVEEKIIDEVGGIHEAFQKLYAMIEGDKKTS